MSNVLDIPTKATPQRLPTDALEIAVRVGVSADFVRRVLNGTRRSDKVVRAYRALLLERQKAQVKFQNGTAQ